jgi:hypothetical protein
MHCLPPPASLTQASRFVRWQEALEEAGAPPAAAAEAVVAGVHLVIPLMTPALLQFPKLGRRYFALLAVLLDVYPAQVRSPLHRVTNTIDVFEADRTAYCDQKFANREIRVWHFVIENGY